MLMLKLLVWLRLFCGARSRRYSA